MMMMMASDDCVIESITELSQKWRVGPILIATRIVSPVERLGTELETELLGITAVLGDRRQELLAATPSGHRQTQHHVAAIIWTQANTVYQRQSSAVTHRQTTYNTLSCTVLAAAG